MNLIEQLGGYEKAKTVVDKAPCKTYTYHNHPYQKGYIRCWGGDGKEYFLVSDIEQALLEYRRQHNIFEVGDYFVNYADDVVYTALSIDQNNRMHGKSGDKNVWTYFGRFGLRHATDEEIKAGKRLGVGNEKQG